MASILLYMKQQQEPYKIVGKNILKYNWFYTTCMGLQIDWMNPIIVRNNSYANHWNFLWTSNLNVN